jgi:hypothetical protein
MTNGHAINGVEIFATGEWNGDKYDTTDLDEMVSNFDKVGYRVPIKIGHDEKSGDRAFGWVSAIRRVGNKLVADFTDLPAELYKLIKQKAYDSVSSEVFWNLDRNKQLFRRALKAVALLGCETPGVSDLKPVSASMMSVSGDFRIYSFQRGHATMTNPAETFQEIVDDLVLAHGIDAAEAHKRLSATERGKKLLADHVNYQAERQTNRHEKCARLYRTYGETAAEVHELAAAKMCCTKCPHRDKCMATIVRMGDQLLPRIPKCEKTGQKIVQNYSTVYREVRAGRKPANGD